MHLRVCIYIQIYNYCADGLVCPATYFAPLFFRLQSRSLSLMSGRAAAGVAQKRWPFRQFQQIHNNPVITSSSSTPSDVTIDIPLSDIPTDACTGDKKAYSAASGYQTSHGYAQAVGSEGQQPSVGRRRKAYDGNGNSGGGPGSASPHAMGAAGSSASHSSGAEAEDGKVNPMGRIYRAIWNFSIVTRYLIYVSPLAILLAVPIVIGATIARNVQIGGVQMYWFFTWIEASWLSLWVSKLVAHAFPYVFQFLCGIVSSGTRKYALILRALEIPLSLVGWAIVTLVTFLPVRGVFSPSCNVLNCERSWLTREGEQRS